MSWRTVHIKESEYIRLKLDNLEITKQGLRYHIPLSDIATIILEGDNTTMTTKLLAALSKYNIALIVCDNKYLPTGMYLSYGNYHRTAKRAQQQALWDDELKDNMWTKVVSQKMLNQVAMAEYKKIDTERINIMVDLVSNVTSGDKTNREGHVAKVYFNSLYGLDFSRDDDCLENAAMNFGYTIIRSAVARMVLGQGLLGMLGIFHRNEYNAFNLVDDLMEPFRPLMDYWIHTETLENQEYLDYDSRLRIIDFINQPMRYETTKSTVDQVMQKYISSFVKAMEQRDVQLLHNVTLADFMEVGK